MERDEHIPEATIPADRPDARAGAGMRAGIVGDLCQDIAAGHPLICVCDAGHARTQALEALAAAHGELGHMVHVAAPHAGALLDDLVHVLAPAAPELDARMARRELAVQLTRIAQTARPIALIDDAHTLLPEDIDLLLYFFPGRRATLVLAGSGNPAIWFTGSGPGVSAFEAAVVYELGGEREGGGGHAERAQEAESAHDASEPETASSDAAVTPRDAHEALLADESHGLHSDEDADDTVPGEAGGSRAQALEADGVATAVPPWSVSAEPPASDSGQQDSDRTQAESERALTALEEQAADASSASTPIVTEPVAGAQAARFPDAPTAPPGEPDAELGAGVAATHPSARPRHPQVDAASGARDIPRASPSPDSTGAWDSDVGRSVDSKRSHQTAAPGLGSARAAAESGPAHTADGAAGIARRNRYLALAAIAVIAVVTLLSRLPGERGDDAAPTPVRTPAEATPRVAAPPLLVPRGESAREPGPRAVAGPGERAAPTTGSPLSPPATAPVPPTPASAESAVAVPRDDEGIIALPPLASPRARESAAREIAPAPSAAPDAPETSPSRPPAPAASVAHEAEERLPASATPSAAPPKRAVVGARPSAPRAAPAVDREEVARMYAERAAYEWDQGRLDAAAVSIARGLESDPLNRRLRDLQVMLRSARDADAAP